MLYQETRKCPNCGGAVMLNSYGGDCRGNDGGYFIVGVEGDTCGYSNQSVEDFLKLPRLKWNYGKRKYEDTK